MSQPDLSHLTPEQQAEYQHAAAVMQARAEDLMRMPNVVGVGIGFATRAGVPTDEIAIVVMVAEKFSAQALPADAFIPRRLDGVRLDVQTTGPFHADGAADAGGFSFTAGG
jgi:hypothetical protein